MVKGPVNVTFGLTLNQIVDVVRKSEYLNWYHLVIQCTKSHS